jgi:hypothetical protein
MPNSPESSADNGLPPHLDPQHEEYHAEIAHQRFHRELLRPLIAVLTMLGLVGLSIWVLQPFLPALIWAVTIVGGMLLRHFAFDRGTALPFIIVASIFTLLFLVGWRFVWEWRAAKR